jgi:ubiquinone/menaquinone biosynthesis C-methylase UbiE
MPQSAELDKWAEWLLHRRDGDDDEQRRQALSYLAPVRDRVLDNARVAPGDVLLDVGAGDGLIAFGAMGRVLPGGRVIFSDISEDLIDHARASSQDLGFVDHISFLACSAQDLAVEDASVDVVTTRSVLIYVMDKAKAFVEFARVLKPGGRLSIFEPINNYFPISADEFWGYESKPVSDLVRKVYEREGWTASNHADDPMMNFTDKDLVRYAEEAGFAEIGLELKVEVKPSTWVVDWDRLLNTSPNPNAHTVGEALEGALTTDERERLAAHVRPLVDAGRAVWRSAEAYLTASMAGH